MHAIIEDNQGKLLRMEFPVYTFHIDYSRHVSNLVYVQWMESARCTLLEAAGLPIAKMGEMGFLPVLTETQIRYHSPLYLGDTARLEAWVSEFRGASAWVEYRITRPDGALAAHGRQKGLFVRADNLRPYRFPPEQRALFEPFIRTEECGDEPAPRG
ncbi:MAG TPA: thioesterase family protein [Armatimonadota bacterium]|jgi:YbgC/YbaW family acyl-CoA thioester hydrolase